MADRKESEYKAGKKGPTPMQVQYRQIKEDYPDCLLFYRMGDFYEMFDDDALIGSKALDIMLTSRSKDENASPMCGVPYHAADVYIAKLLDQGFNVAICEQVEDPKTAKGLVRREVVRVITPGTVMDSSLITEGGPNYLAAVFPIGEGYGLAYADVTTGEFFVSQTDSADALCIVGDELAAVEPRECILPKVLMDDPFFLHHAWDLDGMITMTQAKDEIFVRNNAETLLLTHFKVPSLESLGLGDMEGGVQAAAILLHFCQATQKRDLDYINRLQVYNIENYVMLDANTRRNLELTTGMRTGKKKDSLFGVCDKCQTALGSRLLRKWLEKPLLDSDAVNMRLDGIEELLSWPMFHNNLRDALKGVADIERLIGRVVYGNATPRDILSLKHSFAGLPDIEIVMLQLQGTVYDRLHRQFDTLEDIYKRIDETLYDRVACDGGGDAVPFYAKKEKEPDMIVRPGCNAEIDELREIRKHGADLILQMEARERERTGIKTLKICFNKVFGYSIEVRKSSVDMVPDDYVRRQTLVNCERYITQELKELEAKLLGADERLQMLEQQVLSGLKEVIIQSTARIQKTAACVAWMDCLSALAVLAEENSYVRPVVDDSDCLILKAARHPVVELAIGRENYIPNDTDMLGDVNRFALITGPNMAGKSTYMRQVALAVILARAGSFIPAEAAHIGRVDRIFTRIGASDDLSAGQSTFMVEMSETSNILRNATRDSLIILDEIGRGTSTYDGLSIAWAVAEYIMRPEISARTLFATHYHELIALAAAYPQVTNYSVAVRESGGSIVFLRKIVEGGTDKSYGVHVAKLAGLPQQVISRAEQLLHTLEAERAGVDNAGKLIGSGMSDMSNAGNICNISSVSSISDISDFLHRPEDVAGVIESGAEMKNPAESRVIEELSGLNIANMRPVEALLYLEKWQDELSGNNAGE